MMPLAFILPGPLFQPEQRASDADRDTAVDILCAAVAEGRLTLAELDERAGAALSAPTIGELAALIADLPGPWTAVPASASAHVSPPASPGRASRAPERWSLLQSLADHPVLPGQLVPVSLSRSAAHGDKMQQHAGSAWHTPMPSPGLDKAGPSTSRTGSSAHPQRHLRDDHKPSVIGDMRATNL